MFRDDEKIDDINERADRELTQRSIKKSIEEDKADNEIIQSVFRQSPNHSATPHAEDDDEDAAYLNQGTRVVGHSAYSLITMGEDEEKSIDASPIVIDHIPTLTREEYHAANLIDLNNAYERDDAAMNFSTQTLVKQTQLMDYYKKLIEFSRKNHDALSTQLTYLPPNPDGNRIKSPFAALPDDKQKELLDFYMQTYKIESAVINIQGWLGYMGEFFYLYWDMMARMSVFRRLLPNAPEAANQAINYTATLPITMANVTYWPPSLARGYMESKMLYQKSFTRSVWDNKFKSMMFILYAFGGGYVEIVDINDDLDVLTLPGKIMFESFLIVAAVAYYYSFQFNDSIEMSAKYSDVPSLLKRVLNPFNQRSAKDRAVDTFNAMHEFLSVVERIFRMAYGGFEAGRQQSGDALAIGLGTTVGAATAQTCIGLRAYTLREKYSIDAFTEDQVRLAQTDYDSKYANSFIKRELKLFFTPSLLLIAPAAVWATSFATNAVDHPAAKIAVGTATAAGSLLVMHTGLFLRLSAERRLLVDTIRRQEKRDLATVIPNTLAYAVSGSVNLLDQTSRVLSFGFIMMEMFPGLFDLDNMIGKDMLMTVLFLDAFIAISAWLYQKDKSAEAYKGYSPKWFGKKVEITQGQVGLLNSRAGTPVAEADLESHHDAVPLVTAQIERSDAANSPSRCSIM